MKVFRVLVPIEPRSFRGKRWTSIVLRSLHLVGVAGLGGGFLYGVSREIWLPYFQLAMLTGLAMLALELWSSAIFVIQLRGLSVFLKIGALYLAPLMPGFEPHILVFVILISGVMSHAPGDVRYFSVLHGRRVDDL